MGEGGWWGAFASLGPSDRLVLVLWNIIRQVLEARGMTREAE